MLARRILLAFVLERLQRRDQPRTRIARHQYLVDITQLRRLERIREGLAIFLDQPALLRDRIFRLLDLAAENNIDRAVRTHHRDLRTWVGEIEIAANMLRR